MNFKINKLIMVFVIAMFFVSVQQASAQVFNQARTDTWSTDGVINSIVTTGTTAYVGGSFYYIGPGTGYGFPMNISSGQQFTSFPSFNGPVYSVVPDTSGGWYVAGNFDKVGNYTRTYLVHILSDGSVDTSFNHTLDALIFVLALSPDKGTLYLGGNFTSINGNGRQHVAAIDLSGNTVTAWNPTADGSIESIATTGTTVYVGGSFINIASVPRNYIAALDATTGNATAWDPNANSSVTEMVLNPVSNELIVSGNFSNIGSEARSFLASIDFSTGTSTSWDPNPDSKPESLFVYGNTLYLGGGFSNIDGQARNYVAAIDMNTGSVTAWDPSPDSNVYAVSRVGANVYIGGIYSNIGGGSRYCLSSVDATTGNVTAWDLSVSNNPNAIVPNISDTLLFVGGEFTLSNGILRNNIAAIDLATGRPISSWAPEADNEVLSLAFSPDGSLLYTGGSFTAIGGQSRNRIAALNRSTGLATAWDPDADATVRKIIVKKDGGTLYVGGDMTTINATGIGYAAGVSATSGAVVWSPSLSRPAHDLVLNGAENKIYIAEGKRTFIGGFPPTILKRGQVMEFDTATTTSLANWTIGTGDINYALALSPDEATLYVGGLFSGGGSVPYDYLLAIDIATQNVASWNANVGGGGIYDLALSPDGGYLFIGGDFTSVNGSVKNYASAVKTADALLTGWNPTVDSTVKHLNYTGSVLYMGGSFGKVDDLIRQTFAVYNSPTVQFSLSSSHGLESTANVNLQVSLSQVNSADVFVSYGITGGNATQNVDYTISGSSVTIPAGSLTANIPLTILSDAIPEVSERINVTLSNPINATLGSIATHIYEIDNNESGSGGGSGGGGSIYMYASPSEPDQGFGVVINSQDAKTGSRVVNLSFLGQGSVDPVANKIEISNTPDFKQSILENYQKSRLWDLCWGLEPACTSGKYTVYVRYYTAYGVASDFVTDEIEYEPTYVPVVQSGLQMEQIGSVPLVTLNILLPASILFSKNLSLGMINMDVNALQKFLNDNGFMLAEFGPGSPGNETSMFGVLTRAAVIKFQEAYADQILKPLGLSKGTGYFGPSTRKFINSLFK